MPHDAWPNTFENFLNITISNRVKKQPATSNQSTRSRSKLAVNSLVYTKPSSNKAFTESSKI